MVPSEIFIDAALWRGDTLEERLATHFADLGTVETFKRYMAGQHDRDSTAKLNKSSRRIYDRSGGYMLAAEGTWRGEDRRWLFPMMSWFTAPDTGKRYFVFEARVKRIGLDMASRCLMRYQRLLGVENKKLAD
ncbi:hypothetical protein PY365_27130 [Roseiarcaceae bacterium H3SJ34-1]|uniref:hypothetical protein n=1 Tax=Terripilifer ovatus TaxID=3032367 RepID=UPI003AB95A64|nr:hypothetical protein [Roseiarcaceae bacterium H3SJ34-1]